MYQDFTPQDAEIISIKRLKKLDFKKQFEDAQVLFINYQYENSYNHILTKLLSLAAIMPTMLQAIIVGLPPNATFVDTHIAEQL